MRPLVAKYKDLVEFLIGNPTYKGAIVCQDALGRRKVVSNSKQGRRFYKAWSKKDRLSK